ncbi:MAG TPA: DUF5658 family protein [Steroidobacteraceae bacterium]|jgi:hypothetical protein
MNLSHRAAAERRARPERRHRRLWSVWYGSFNPRRRSPARRIADDRFHTIDWYSPHLLAVAIVISLLCVADAFLTLMLLANGADEINPVMALLLYRSVAAFTAAKMATTGVSLLALVVLSRYRFMRLVKVEVVMYLVLAAYISLIGYELWLLRGQVDPAILQFY